jgi:hypothetical protein
MLFRIEVVVALFSRSREFGYGFEAVRIRAKGKYSYHDKTFLNPHMGNPTSVKTADVFNIFMIIPQKVLKFYMQILQVHKSNNGLPAAETKQGLLGCQVSYLRM